MNAGLGPEVLYIRDRSGGNEYAYKITKLEWECYSHLCDGVVCCRYKSNLRESRRRNLEIETRNRNLQLFDRFFEYARCIYVKMTRIRLARLCLVILIPERSSQLKVMLDKSDQRSCKKRNPVDSIIIDIVLLLRPLLSLI